MATITSNAKLNLDRCVCYKDMTIVGADFATFHIPAGEVGEIEAACMDAVSSVFLGADAARELGAKPCSACFNDPYCC